MIDTTTDYGKQAYVMCEDLANQLNYLKNKHHQNNSSNSTSNTTMLELLGGVGSGTVKKNYLTFNTTAEVEVNYTVVLKITNSSLDEQFEAHIYFDNNLMGKKVFMVNNSQANVLYDFAYTSTTGSIDVEIVVCSATATTTFCLDQIITIATTDALTCDYPNRYDDGTSFKLSLCYMGSPNLHGFGPAYSYAFEQDRMMYTGVLEAKHFDMQRLNYYCKTSPFNFCAYATLGLQSDGSIGFGNAMMCYTSSSRTYYYNHNTKTQKASALYLQSADIAPYTRSGYPTIECQAIMKYNQEFGYNVLSNVFNSMELYSFTFPDNDLVDKLVMCKPRTLQEAQTILPFIMVDTDKIAFIYYNYVDARENKFYTISNVDDICCVYGSTTTELHVYASVGGVCYLYKLNYNSSTRTFTQKSMSKVGEFAMYYPGFDNDAFYMVGNTICFTKHKDLL